jgi:hypothetical protein
VSCRGNVGEFIIESAISFPNVSTIFNFTSPLAQAYIDFPLGYVRDSVASDYLNPVGGAQLHSAVGKLSGMNLVNRTGFRAAELDRLQQEDPTRTQQFTLFRSALEFKKFTNAFYDPTVTLTSLFTDSDPLLTPTLTPQVDYGLVVGVPVGAVLGASVVGVVALFLLNDGLRKKVAPFFGRRSPSSQLEDLEDSVEKSATADRRTWKSSRPTGNHPI